MRCSGSRASNKLGHALTDAAEATELVSLKTNVKTSAFRQTLKMGGNLERRACTFYLTGHKVTLLNHINGY